MMDEAKLIEKLRLIEALFAGATTTGERVAADFARLRILERLKSVEVADPPVEYKFTLGDLWSRRVFVALLRRYNLSPYRYRGQRYTTVMVKVSKRFVQETLWPEFQEISDTLRTYLTEVTNRVVSDVLHQDDSEAAEVEQQTLALGPSSVQVPSDGTPGENGKPLVETPTSTSSSPGIPSSSATGVPSTKGKKHRHRKKNRRR